MPRSISVSRPVLLAVLGAGLASCTSTAPEQASGSASLERTASPGATESRPLTLAEQVQTRPLFGDLHMHTAFSFDAFTFKTTATPDDAYSFAQGNPLAHPAGGVYELNRPLDFLAVTDHAEFMGVTRAFADPANPLSQLPIAAEVTNPDPKIASAGFQRLAGALRDGTMESLLGPRKNASAVVEDAWTRVKAAANRHYQPGKFTTLIGYEFTASSEGRNLHRNVIYRTADAPLPFSTVQSRDPADLWRFLEGVRQRGYPVLSIPHNSNASDGVMFGRADYTGKPIDAAYAALRLRNEPIVEVTQVKGTSETHPTLSPNDEFANYEILPTYIASPKRVTKFAGGYVRDALGEGLAMQDGEGFNPYRFGLIGSTDSHTAIAPVDEDNYSGKVGVLDGTAKARLDCTYCTGSDYRNFAAAGLAVVWAPQNTREAVWDALARKETYATTGPRMQVRFFGGWDYGAVQPGRGNWIEQAYARGVPMGGTLMSRRSGRPVFLVSALKDPEGANLDRVQIVKVWTKGGRHFEKVFDVALSGGRKVDPRTGKAPPVGNTINRKTMTFANTIGAPSLQARWSDPEFDPATLAAYYVRVLEIPTPRWSSYDAHRLGREPLTDWAFSIQERAFTSPIWYDAQKPVRY
ncbi:DUF3604 domain-containing protein [Sphingopyxis witflariensis]|uniref:DUF3604 domain-containing protein n=1 Tax=Sphingopyxis witflariensis TaxID=173675 RepID=A0A246JYW6_9SPHN|nr:DUF3604 domain-containing protein [Sphingopyxis witflariensis]OWQ98381.1 hypothetical protein CDQ91_07780 [Sphingopyxis witflariensis]